MRKIITVLSCLLLVCLFSCSDDNKIIQDRYEINNVSESISSSYEVSKDTQINLSILKVALSMEYFLPLLVVAGVLVEIIILVSSQLVAVLIFFLRNHQPYLSMLMR